MAQTARPLDEAPLPTILRWQEPDHPLPVRAVRCRRGPARALGLEAPRGSRPARRSRPFDFCGHVRRLCADVVRRCAGSETHRRVAAAVRHDAGAQRPDARPAGARDAAALPQRLAGAPPRRRLLPGAALRRRWTGDALSGHILSAALPRPGRSTTSSSRSFTSCTTSARRFEGDLRAAWAAAAPALAQQARLRRPHGRSGPRLPAQRRRPRRCTTSCAWTSPSCGTATAASSASSCPGRGCCPLPETTARGQ